MVLAAIDPVIFEEVELLTDEVQLLADCFATPVFTKDIPIAAEALIPRDLVRAFAVQTPCTCFLLVITDEGRSQVETWIERHALAA